MDGHPFLFHPFVIDGAFWLQTNGASLLAVKRCSLERARLTAQDGHSAPGLLYSTAVRLV
jgi:hypothetical protein